MDTTLNHTVFTSAFVDLGCLCLATISMRTAVRCKASILPISPRSIAQVVNKPNPPVIDCLAVLCLGFGGYDERNFAYIIPGQKENLILGQNCLKNHDTSLRPAQNQGSIRRLVRLCLSSSIRDTNTLPISHRTVRAFHVRARNINSVRIFSTSLLDLEKALKSKIYTDPYINCPYWLLSHCDEE